jgi:multiple sugar transport system permease protein
MQANGIRLKGGERWWLWFFLAPTLFGLTFGTLGPVLAAIGISFTKWDVLTRPIFTGLDNYAQLIADPTFQKSILNTIYYVLGTVPAATVLALVLALLLNQKLRGITFYRTAYFLPIVSSTVAVALVWSWIYSKDFGLLNFLLRNIGLQPVAWLTSARYAMPALIIMGIWGLLGEGMIIFLAGLQGISQSYYEAAEVDGANAWKKFLHITLPMITPSMFFYFIITMINAFQAFEQIYVMTRGGPNNATTTMVYYVYTNAFRNFRMGYASAQAIGLFLIVMILTLIYWRSQDKWVVYDD